MTDHSSPTSNPATSDAADGVSNGATSNATNGATANTPSFRVPDGAPQGTQARGALLTDSENIEVGDVPAEETPAQMEAASETPAQSTLSEPDTSDLQGSDDYVEPWNDEQGPNVAPDELPEEFVDWPENNPTPASELEADETESVESDITPTLASSTTSNEREASGWEPPVGSGYEDYPSSGVATSVGSEPDYDNYTYTNQFVESGSASDFHHETPGDDSAHESTLETASGGSGAGGDGGDFGGGDLPADDDARVPSHYQESLDPNAPVNDREQDLIEHLGELRTRILHSVLVVALLTVGTWTYVKPISEWFSRPIRQALDKFTAPGTKAEIITIDPTEGFMTSFQISFVAAVLIGMPFLLFQIWRFVEPALTGRERRFTGTLIPFAIILFFTGSALGYAVSPLFFQFFLQYQPPGTTPNYSYSASILILAKMLLVFGVCFQVPVIVIFLHKAGVVSRNVLIEYWRHVIVVIFVVVAILTPTWDPLTLVICGAPPCLLYVGSIWLIKWL